VTHRPVAQAGREVSNSDRLMSMAQVYEQKGQLQQAHKLYCQVLQQNPNHAAAREHATDLMAAISNAQSAKDPAAEQLASNASPSASSGLTVSSVAPAPTDPALLGRQGRKVLSDEEVAARVPKPRLLAEAAAPAKDQVATVMHQELKAGNVTPAEQIDERPLPPAVITIDQPIVVVAPAPAEEPAHVTLPVAEPLFLEAPPQAVTSSEPELLPDLTSTQARIIVQSAPAVTWVKTSVANLCPNAPAEFRDLLASLEATDPEARKAALEDLGNCGRLAVTCLPAVRNCLTDADPLVQAHAAWALWTITGQSTESIRCLTSVLDCNQEEAIAFSCYVLGTMGPQAREAAPKLTSLQNDDSTTIRVHAAEAMLKVDPTGAQAVHVLKASLASHRADERSLAAVSLGSAVGKDRAAAISALITALYDADSGVRCSAALALGGFGRDAASAISALEVAASATDTETRDAATTALACIRR